MLIYQSFTRDLFGALGLGVLLGSPWIVATVWLWSRHQIDDGTATPSLGETALRRLGL
jgi:hypothetical protein